MSPWQVVIRQIAQQLNDADIRYKIVGGAAVALHGVLDVVNDVDIETDLPNARQIEVLWRNYVVLALEQRASDTYRSYFGRFMIDGLSIEVMANLERREGDQWRPTTTLTETHVTLDGVPVRVSWLEEETLAYIRRDRLKRAGDCLPYCNRDRLLALIRGTQPTNVI